MHDKKNHVFKIANIIEIESLNLFFKCLFLKLFGVYI